MLFTTQPVPIAIIPSYENPITYKGPIRWKTLPCVWQEKELALHENQDGGKSRNGRPVYTITHRPTGLAIIMDIPRKDEAIRVMKQLVKVADWEFGLQTIQNPEFMRKLTDQTEDIRTNCRRV